MAESMAAKIKLAVYALLLHKKFAVETGAANATEVWYNSWHEDDSRDMCADVRVGVRRRDAATFECKM